MDLHKICSTPSSQVTNLYSKPKRRSNDRKRSIPRPKLKDILNAKYPNYKITPDKICKQLCAVGLVDIDETLRNEKKVGNIYHDILMEYQQRLYL